MSSVNVLLGELTLQRRHRDDTSPVTCCGSGGRTRCLWVAGLISGLAPGFKSFLCICICITICIYLFQNRSHHDIRAQHKLTPVGEQRRMGELGVAGKKEVAEVVVGKLVVGQ